MTKLMKADEVAEYMNLSQDRVYALTRENILPCVKIGRQLRWSEKALIDFIENGGKSFSGPGGWRKEAS